MNEFLIIIAVTLVIIIILLTWYVDGFSVLFELFSELLDIISYRENDDDKDNDWGSP